MDAVAVRAQRAPVAQNDIVYARETFKAGDWEEKLRTMRHKIDLVRSTCHRREENGFLDS